MLMRATFTCGGGTRLRVSMAELALVFMLMAELALVCVDVVSEGGTR